MTDRVDDPDETKPSSADMVRAKAERLDNASSSAELVKRDTDKAPVPTSIEALRDELNLAKEKLKRYRKRAVKAGTAVALFAIVAVIVVVADPTTSGALQSSSPPPSTTTSSSSSSPSLPSSDPQKPSLPESTTPSALPSVTGSASAVSVQPPTPGVHDSGQKFMYQGSRFDLDEDDDYYYSGGDITHDNVSISGVAGATLARGGTGADEYSRCSTVPVNTYQSHMRFSELSIGAVLCVRTDEGRLAYVELSGLPDQDGSRNLTFRWTTWKK